MQLPKLKIDDLEVDTPIIQGGMGIGISLSNLASAVANQGGIGVISSVGLGFKHEGSNVENLLKEINKAKSNTNGILGVNIMAALTDYEKLVKASMNKVDIILVGAGLPLSLPGLFSKKAWQEKNTKIAVIVSSARAAKIIFMKWERKYGCVPDAVVIEGPKAGGHLGYKLDQIGKSANKLEKTLPKVEDTIDKYRESHNKNIPTIAAGGIYYGKDIKNFLDLGAAGVKMGTRFVGTKECDADKNFKQQYIESSQEDIKIIESPLGLPGRAINNNFLEQVSQGIKKPFQCPWKCMKSCKVQEAPYCIAEALLNAKKGILEEGFAFAGANGYLVDKIISVKKLFQNLKLEFERATTEEKEFAFSN